MQSVAILQMEWLLEPIPLETEIEIEHQAREMLGHPKADQVAAMMIRHSYKLQHMLNLAVMEIARLEGEAVK